MSSKKHRKLLWMSLVKQDFKCYYCDSRIYMNKSGCTVNHKLSATLDHYIPRSQGGTLEKQNRVAVCFQCNQKKDALYPHEFLRGQK